MADLEPDRGAFLSILQALDRPGQALRNVLRGNYGAAGRQLGQLGADVVDSVIPGDFLPNDIAKPEDFVSGSDLIGMDDSYGPLKTVADIGVGALTDPLSYIPGAWVAKGLGKAGALAAKGVSAVDKVLPGTEKAVQAVGRTTRSVFNQQRVMPELRQVIDPARNTAQIEGQAGLGAAQTALKGLDERQLKVVGDALDNFKWGEDGKLAGELVPTSADPISGIQSGTLADRIAAHPEALPEEVPILAKAAEDVAAIGRTQKARPGIFTRANGEGAMDVVTGERAPLLDTAGDLSDEYLGRQYTGLPPKDVLEEAMGGASRTSATSERKLQNWQEVRDFLAKPENAGAAYERNALVRVAKRAEQQGTLSQRADIGQGVIDLLRQGKLKLPEDMVVEEAAKLRNGASAPVPPSGSYADVGAMLGGPRAPLLGDEGGRVALDRLGKNLSGHAAEFEQANAEALGRVPDWMDHQAKQSVDGYFERLAEFQKLHPEAIEVPGDWRPGDPSPKSIVTADGERHLGDSLNKALGVTEQSGKSVVGASAKQPGLSMADLKPHEVEAATQSILGKDFAYTDPQSRKIVTGTLQALAKSDPESAKYAMDAVNGIAPRGTLARLIAQNNTYFKKAATYGILLPKLGSIVRNRLGGIWQTLSNPESRGATAGVAKRFISDLGGAVSDSLGMSIGKDKFTGILSDWDHALGASGGSADRAIQTLAQTQPEAAALIKAGALDGFVRSEDLVRTMMSTPWKKKFGNMLDWPGRIFKGVEDRLRLGLGLDLMKQGKSAEEAARITGDALYRYGSTSAENATARTLIPYFQWTANAIPAEAKFLMEKPFVATAIAGGMTQDPKQPPLYPYLANRMNVDLGTDENGNRNVIGGFGLPFENLASIPNPSASIGDFGRQTEQALVGQSNPLIKSLYGMVSGHDPNFETPYGSYDKIPIVGHAGEAGRMFNTVAGTGLLQPLVTPAQIIDKWTDDRRSLPLRAVDSLTGANVVTVDPDRALVQQLTDALQRNPEVGQESRPVNYGHDADVQELIDALNRAKGNIRAKKKQAKAGLP